MNRKDMTMDFIINQDILKNTGSLFYHEKGKEDKNIAAFLSFSPIYRWEINYYDDFNELRLYDLRYRNDGHYPFIAVVQIDDNNCIMNSFTGWIYSERKLQNKLSTNERTV